MFFCQNCNNVFDITKTSKQTGGKDSYEDVITKILNNDKMDKSNVEKISIEELVNNPSYKKLKGKQKETVYNKIQDLLPIDSKKLYTESVQKGQTEKAHFICTNCGNTKPIEKGTLIFSRASMDVAKNYSSPNVNQMQYSDILLRTRKYLCPNKTCESHNNLEKREAIFFRTNNTFRIKYICLTCNAAFDN